ncbi:helix-turn-helix transcriptional regulator [Mycoplasmatota bacterium WC44]
MSVKTVKGFGNSVRYYRLEQKLSQEKLSNLCGLHRTYIGSVERGEKNATIKVVFALADALKIDAGEFFKREIT